MTPHNDKPVLAIPGPNPLKAVCCICGATIREGHTAPDGGVSHGYCIPCANTVRKEMGLPPFTDAELEQIKKENQS